MKILYGIQGTGNGHISRARVLAPKLAAAGFDVSFLFSGRPHDSFFDMAAFGNYQWRRGLTFTIEDGQVKYLKTLLHSGAVTFLNDVASLDLSAFDLVITDFEPVSAWAAKRQKKPSIGLGHQYAFEYRIPKSGSNPIANIIMRYFAPADIPLGLHWFHFDQPILPPIVNIPTSSGNTLRQKILVYLPFEDIDHTVTLLTGFRDHVFHLFHPDVSSAYQRGNIVLHPLSHTGFQAQFSDCSSVLTNAGFELAAESLQAGKKLLVKPVHKQMEQLSNARALEQLGFGRVMQRLDPAVIRDWLKHDETSQVLYPDTAQAITDWLAEGQLKLDSGWIRRLWQNTGL